MAAERRTARVVERHADAPGDRRLRRHRDHEGGRRFRRPGGAHRHVRQRRHAVGGEADPDPARLHVAAVRRAGRGRSVSCATNSRTRRPTSTTRLARHVDGQALPRRRQRSRPADGRRPEGLRRPHRRASTATVVAEFFRTAEHPKLGRPYRTCGYQPMVELLRFLEANGFVTYIASGGDRDFMRPVAGDLYGIPPERVIGSSLAIDYRESDDDRRDVLYKAEMEFFDDGPTKPVRIWSRIGRRPVLACGNSNGDIPMLRFARTRRSAGAAPARAPRRRRARVRLHRRCGEGVRASRVRPGGP